MFIVFQEKKPFSRYSLVALYQKLINSVEESISSYFFFYQLNYFNSASSNTYMSTFDISFIWKNDLCELLTPKTIQYRAHSVPAGGEYSWEFLVGVCRPVLQILTLFQTKKCHFPHPFSDQTSKLHNVFRPGL